MGGPYGLDWTVFGYIVVVFARQTILKLLEGFPYKEVFQ